MLTGAIASGMMLATTMSNAGGAWDNSRNHVAMNGVHGGKGTYAHKACIVGHTIGNPCKDSSAPVILVLVKVMMMVSVTIAHILKGRENWDYFYFGFIPVVVFIYIILMFYIYSKKKTSSDSSSHSVEGS